MRRVTQGNERLNNGWKIYNILGLLAECPRRKPTGCSGARKSRRSVVCTSLNSFCLSSFSSHVALRCIHASQVGWLEYQPIATGVYYPPFLWTILANQIQGAEISTALVASFTSLPRLSHHMSNMIWEPRTGIKIPYRVQGKGTAGPGGTQEDTAHRRRRSPSGLQRQVGSQSLCLPATDASAMDRILDTCMPL